MLKLKAESNAIPALDSSTEFLAATLTANTRTSTPSAENPQPTATRPLAAKEPPPTVSVDLLSPRDLMFSALCPPVLEESATEREPAYKNAIYFFFFEHLITTNK
jgi:hypothetical protein